MRKQERYKRFTGMNNELLSLRCHWYAQANNGMEPMGSSNDDIHKRPDYVQT